MKQELRAATCVLFLRSLPVAGAVLFFYARQ